MSRANKWPKINIYILHIDTYSYSYHFYPFWALHTKYAHVKIENNFLLTSELSFDVIIFSYDYKYKKLQYYWSTNPTDNRFPTLGFLGFTLTLEFFYHYEYGPEVKHPKMHLPPPCVKYGIAAVSLKHCSLSSSLVNNFLSGFYGENF